MFFEFGGRDRIGLGVSVGEAVFLQGALVACWRLGLAHLRANFHESLVELAGCKRPCDCDRLGEVPELFLGGRSAQGCFASEQTGIESLRVGFDDSASLVVGERCDGVCCVATDAGQVRDRIAIERKWALA